MQRINHSFMELSQTAAWEKRKYENIINMKYKRITCCIIQSMTDLDFSWNVYNTERAVRFFLIN